MKKLFKTTIPFQGFCCSIHDDQIDFVIENETEYYINELRQPKSDVETWQESIDYAAIRKAYSKHYVNFANSELDLASLEYKDLESPREYNFITDRIICTISYDDVKKLYDLYIGSDAFRVLIQNTFTSYDGFISFYSNDINSWKSKALDRWDLNEIGILILCHWKALNTDEMESLDFNMRPVSEIIINELPVMN